MFRAKCLETTVFHVITHAKLKVALNESQPTSAISNAVQFIHYDYHITVTVDIEVDAISSIATHKKDILLGNRSQSTLGNPTTMMNSFSCSRVSTYGYM